MHTDLVPRLLAIERSSRLLAPAAAALAADDPFRLVVPPLVPPAEAEIDAATLETLAGLYLLAQVEQTGLPAAAELLVAERLGLDLRSADAAQLLEDTADASRDWIPRASREQLFARVFGTGPGAAVAHVPANTDFLPALSDTASAISAYDRAILLGGPLIALRSQLSRAAARLRSNLAPRQHGNTVLATGRIAAQARQAVALLSHPGILALVNGTSAWDVVRATWPDDERPDIDRLVALGQSGQTLITWSGSPPESIADPPEPARAAAATWLAESGLAGPAGTATATTGTGPATAAAAWSGAVR
ncbi:hypothetical protein ACQPZX_28115 [Actinoplanes sp. CA-142083]|uniref:hypothetical protein n=1 Tax=Actinoplanes sp. CA-142083 TaxID=3239903 RepID=UPI003D93D426